MYMMDGTAALALAQFLAFHFCSPRTRALVFLSFFQAALKKGVPMVRKALTAIAPTLPFPGEQAANLLLRVLDVADQVRVAFMLPCACNVP